MEILYKINEFLEGSFSFAFTTVAKLKYLIITSSMIVFAILCATVDAAELESARTPEEQRRLMASMEVIKYLVLNDPSADDPISVDNPPWAPASCAIIIEGKPYKCWCEEPDKPTGCVAL